jgi:ZIP family zinc transporter
MSIRQVSIALLLSFFAGSGTALGGALVILSTRGKKITKQTCGIMSGFSAGVMVLISLLNLLPEVEKEVGMVQTRVAFFLGVVIMLILQRWVGEDDAEVGSVLHRMENLVLNRGMGERSSPLESGVDQNVLSRVALLSWIGMAAHNLPEGSAVFLSTLKDVSLGVPLALAIFLHNAPEGLVVGATLMAATNNARHVMVSCFINGMMEPLGVLLTWIIFGRFLTESTVNFSLGMVAGVMTALSVVELLPVAIDLAGKRLGGYSFFAGMLMASILIEAMRK